jgi:hypothetical protein
MSNYHGGTLAAKNKFFKDLQDDFDFILHKNNSYSNRYNQNGSHVNYGTVSVAKDPFCADKKIGEIVKKYTKI